MAKYTIGQKRAYLNLTSKCYSIQEYTQDRSWKVIAHVDSFIVDSAYGQVSEPTRQRVIAGKKRFVHAYIYGEFTLDCSGAKFPASTEKVTYNPYKYDQFKVINTRTEQLNNLNDYLRPTIYATISNSKYPSMALLSN